MMAVLKVIHNAQDINTPDKKGLETLPQDLKILLQKGIDIELGEAILEMAAPFTEFTMGYSEDAGINRELLRLLLGTAVTGNNQCRLLSEKVGEGDVLRFRKGLAQEIGRNAIRIS